MDKVLSEELETCTTDMKTAVQTGRIALEAQVRAYDLLEFLLDAAGADVPQTESSAFCAVYDELEAGLQEAYDAEYLRIQAEEVLRPLREVLDEAAAHAGKMTDLHECAKATYEIWQNGGVFARHKALRTLRRKAGFRLESKRIGNYVAKTFDLMNEARTAFARAQQALFAADVSYKTRPGIYAEIVKNLR